MISELISYFYTSIYHSIVAILTSYKIVYSFKTYYTILSKYFYENITFTFFGMNKLVKRL